MGRRTRGIGVRGGVAVSSYSKILERATADGRRRNQQRTTELSEETVLDPNPVSFNVPVTMPMPEGYAQIEWTDSQTEGRACCRLRGDRNDRGYRNDSAKLLHDQAPGKKRLDLAGII